MCPMAPPSAEGRRARAGAWVRAGMAWGFVLCLAAHSAAEAPGQGEMPRTEPDRGSLLGTATWAHEAAGGSPPYWRARMARLSDGRILCLWPTDHGRTAGLGGAVYQEGRWDAIEPIALAEACDEFSLDVSGDGATLVTIQNKQDAYASIRWFDLSDVLPPTRDKSSPPKESRAVRIDLSDPKQRVERSSNGYWVTDVASGPGGTVPTWIFGRYIEAHREYLVFFWGGGHIPTMMKTCAWAYQEGALSGCRPLWEGRGSFGDLFHLLPYGRPVHAVDDRGTPYVAFIKESGGPLAPRKAEPFLAWYDNKEWKKEKIDVLGETPRGYRNYDEPVKLVAAEGGMVLLWSRRREGWSELLLLRRDGQGWSRPVTVAADVSLDNPTHLTMAAPMAMDGGTAHVVWSSRRQRSDQVGYRSITGENLGPSLTWDASAIVRQVLVAPDARGGLVHIAWSHQKTYNEHACRFYATSFPLIAPGEGAAAEPH